MNGRRKWLALAAWCVVLIVVLFWQRTQIIKLQQQNTELRVELATWFVGPQPRGEVTRSPGPELLRLRAEVAELRGQNAKLVRTAATSSVKQPKSPETGELPYETRVQHNTWGLMRLSLAMRSVMAEREEAGAAGKCPIVGADGQLTPELRRECEKFLREDDTTSAVDFSTVWPDVELVITDAADIRKLDGNTIVARTVAIKTPEGKWTRVYVLADGSGHRRVHGSPDEVWQGQP